MRLSSVQWLLCAASSTVVAASATAKVYVYDSDTGPQASASSPETVNPATARLILAQRLGLEQHHSISDADDESIRQINVFSSQQQPLFGHEKHVEPTSRLLMVVEGINEEDFPTMKGFDTFSISPAPHPEDSNELFSTFASEAADLPMTDGQDHQLLKALTVQAEQPQNTLKTFANQRALLHVKATHEMEYLDLLGKTIQEIYGQARERKMSLSIMFNPPASKSSKPSSTPFGLTKRSTKGRRDAQEQPLISKQHSASSPEPSHAEPISPFIASKVLSGPIPTCFPSLSACERGTNNCTSHGSCILKWSTETTNDGGSVSKQDCFGCACTKPEVRTNKDGTKKTTNFGGAACHKKDIVFPFWLLAGTTIFIMGIVGFGLSMLYEMGNQELPSVIGAGVSGPKAR